MKRMVITGASGYLASLIQLYNKDEFEFIRVSRRDVDYSKPEEVSRYFSSLDFDVLFHTAANATTAPAGAPDTPAVNASEPAGPGAGPSKPTRHPVRKRS